MCRKQLLFQPDLIFGQKHTHTLNFFFHSISYLHMCGINEKTKHLLS